jgi:hypothetical protein
VANRKVLFEFIDSSQRFDVMGKNQKHLPTANDCHSQVL